MKTTKKIMITALTLIWVGFVVWRVYLIETHHREGAPRPMHYVR